MPAMRQAISGGLGLVDGLLVGHAWLLWCACLAVLAAALKRRRGPAILVLSGVDDAGVRQISPAGCSAQTKKIAPQVVLPRRGLSLAGLTGHAQGEYNPVMSTHAVRHFWPLDERPWIGCCCGWRYKHKDVMSPRNAENALLDEYNIHLERCAARVVVADAKAG